MKMHATIIGPNGYMAETIEKLRTVVSGSDALLQWLNELPEEVDGQRIVDWTNIDIKIERET